MNTPGIYLERDENADSWVLRQHRPRVGAALVGIDFDTALTRLPLLLPLCKVAQTRAATAAVAALCDRDNDEEATTDRALLREQALSSAWRFLISWPALLGEPEDPRSLRRILDLADDVELAAAVRALLPGLNEVRTVSDFMTWSSDAGCPGARLMALVMEHFGTAVAPTAAASTSGTAPPQLLQAGALLDRVLGCVQGSQLSVDLATTDLAAVAAPPPPELVLQGAGHHNPGPVGSYSANTQPGYVGALAAARHPLIPELAEYPRLGVTASLLGAQILDSMAVADALADNAAPLPGASSHRVLTDNGEIIGIGSATTVRGPLLHVVTRDAKAAGMNAARCWNIFAPTDWHFFDGALLKYLLGVDASVAAARYALAALDPCCASYVELAGTEGAAHA